MFGKFCIIGRLVLVKFEIRGLIAQWIEHPPSKRAVVGSSPTQSVFFLGFIHVREG